MIRRIIAVTSVFSFTSLQGEGVSQKSTAGNSVPFRQYDEEYYEKAMDLFTNDALFVVVSDNMNFAKKVISTKRRNVIFIENDPYYLGSG